MFLGFPEFELAHVAAAVNSPIMFFESVTEPMHRHIFDSLKEKTVVQFPKKVITQYITTVKYKVFQPNKALIVL